jgi:hypothetical protein
MEPHNHQAMVQEAEQVSKESQPQQAPTKQAAVPTKQQQVNLK